MDVQISHHVDASEPGADGLYDYYYEYDVTRFSLDGISLVARSYTDAPHEAHFLRIESGPKHRLLTEEDLRSPLATRAIEHLRMQGKTEIKWLSAKSNGYDVLTFP